MKRIARIIFLCVFALIIMSNVVIAKDYEMEENYFVNDYTNTLSSDKKYEIAGELKNVEEKYNKKIVFLFIDNLESESVKDFTDKMFIDWKIENDYKKCALVVYSVIDNELRIKFGEEFDENITDEIVNQILNKAKEEYFENKEYELGILYIKDCLVENEQKEKVEEVKVIGTKKVSSYNMIFVLAFVMVGILLLSGRGDDDYYDEGYNQQQKNTF